MNVWAVLLGLAPTLLALLTCSGLISAPTLPVAAISPDTIGTCPAV